MAVIDQAEVKTPSVTANEPVATASPQTTGVPDLPLGDSNFRLVPESSAPTPAPVSVTTQQTRHFLRPIVMILLLLGLAVALWWLITSGWTPPWVQPPGPLTASGTLEADEVLVGSELSGRIIELAQEGDPVQADEVVARLDDTMIQLQIRQADVAALQQLQIQADHYQLHSPISGIVTRVPMHTGEVVAPGQTLVAVADLTNLELTAYVLERDLGQVRVGQQVTVTADPFPGRGFRGVITSTNPRAEFTPRNIQTKADRLNLVFGVKIRVENPDGALKPGMPADVIFPPLP